MSVAPTQVTATELDPDTEVFYRRVLQTLAGAGVPVLVGGAYASAIYTGVERHTKDLDLFMQRADYDRVADALAAAGHETELTYPHWLGKTHAGSVWVDLIFNSGNGTTPVDDGWFEHAVEADVLGVRTKIVPVEEIIWSKAFVMERERYDGADIAHLLRARAEVLDWARLLHRFGQHWRVLLSHVVLFGFVYPGERTKVPAWVVERLIERLREETYAAPAADALCRGTLLSREQYLHDVSHEGYMDGRLEPFGTMTPGDIAAWTGAIGERPPDTQA